MHRRDYLAGSSAVGLGLIAGCLGDDDDADLDDTTDEPANDFDDGEDDDDYDDQLADDDDGIADDQDDPDDSPDDPAIDRHDVALVDVWMPELPPDCQYWRWNAPTPQWDSARVASYQMIERSPYDQSYKGIMVEDWSYQPGLLEVDFSPNIYWWSGDRVNAEDYRAWLELENWTEGGEDFNAHPDMITFDVVDEHTIRFSLADTWREDFAIETTFVDETMEVWASREFTQPWIERYEDTGGDLDAVGEVREEIVDYDVNTDDELVHMYHIPFEFRLDGSIGNVAEDHWILDLVPERGGEQRKYVEHINFERLRWYASEEYEIRQTEEFVQGNRPYDSYIDHYPDVEENIDFPVDTRGGGVPEPGIHRKSINLNGTNYPTSNVRFRRAIAYLIDGTPWAAEHPGRTVEELFQPFSTDEWVREFVSDDVIDAFTDYRMDEMRFNEAEAELEQGGFERDADGQWLSGETGEPFDLDVVTFDWWLDIPDEGSDWFEDMEDFGLPLEVDPVWGRWDDWQIRFGYIGGVLPEAVYTSIFGEDHIGWGQAQNNMMPESVEAPEVGETDAPEDEWISYDTRTMADRLAVTVDEDAYHRMVEELTWVSNQLALRSAVYVEFSPMLVNDHHWYVKEHAEAPGRWAWGRDMINHAGLAQYVPEEDR